MVEEPSSPRVPEVVIPVVYSVPPPLIPSTVSLNLNGFPTLEESEVSKVTVDPDFKVVFAANDPSK